MNEFFIRIAELRLKGIKTKISTFYIDTGGQFNDCGIAVHLFKDGIHAKRIIPFEELTGASKVVNELVAELEKGAADD